MVTEPVHIPVTSSGTGAVSRKLKRIGTSAKGANKSLALMRNLLVIVAAARVVKRFVDMADSFVVMQNRLKLVTTSLGNLIEVQEKLFAVSQETGTSFESNVNLFARMARATDRLGLSQKTLIDVTRGINQALVLSGATAQEARNGLVQFSQGLASGTLRGDELRSVVEQFPELARIIGKEFGVAGGELAAFAKKNDGILKTDRIIKAIREALPDLARRFAETNDTIGRGFERVNNAMVKFIGQLGQASGATKGLINVLNFLSKNFDTFVKTIAIAGAGLLVFFTGSFVRVFTGMFTILKKSVFLIGRVSKSFFVTRTILAKLLPRVLLLGLAFATILTGGIFASIVALLIFKDKIVLVEEAGSTLGDGLSAVFEELKPLFTEVKELVKEVGQAIADAFGEKDFQSLFVKFLIGTLDLALRTVLAFRALAAGMRAVIALTKLDTVGAAIQGQIARELFAKSFESTDIEKKIDDATDRRVQKQQEKGDEEIENLFGGKKKKFKSALDDDDGKKFAKTLKSLREELDPVLKANNKLTESILVLDKAFGKDEPEKFRVAMEKIMAVTLDARLPIEAFERALAKELALSKLSTKQRELVIAQEKAITDLKAKTINLTNAQIASAKELVKVTREQMEANQLVNSTLESLRKPGEDFQKFANVFPQLTKEAPEFTEQLTKMRTELEILSLETSPLFADQMRATFLRIQLDSEVTGKTMAEFFGKAFEKMGDFIVDFVDTGKLNLKGLFDFLRRELIKLAVKKAIVGALAGGFANAFGGGGGGADLSGSGEALGDFAAGFSHGGSFNVGGTGGIDSQRVSFAATPGEQVSVQTPAQQLSQGLPFSSRGLNTSLQGVPVQKGTISAAQQTLLDFISGVVPEGSLSSLDFLFTSLFDKNNTGFSSLFFGGVGGDRFTPEAREEERLRKFAHGGSFTVGGSGGTDSQTVKFKATPGERVDISQGGNSGGGRPINVTFNILTPDADSFIKSEGQISAAFSNTMSRHARRNN